MQRYVNLKNLNSVLVVIDLSRSNGREPSVSVESRARVAVQLDVRSLQLQGDPSLAHACTPVTASRIISGQAG